MFACAYCKLLSFLSYSNDPKRTSESSVAFTRGSVSEFHRQTTLFGFRVGESEKTRQKDLFFVWKTFLVLLPTADPPSSLLVGCLWLLGGLVREE